jgi:hypothetical protein
MEMEDWLDELCTNNHDRIDDWDEPTQPDYRSNTPQGQGRAHVSGLEVSKQWLGDNGVCANGLQGLPRVSKDIQGAEGAR